MGEEKSILEKRIRELETQNSLLTDKLAEFEKDEENLSDLKIEDLFKLAELQRLQDLFSEATHVASLILTPDGHPITQPSNFCRLCNDIIRKTEKGRQNCKKSDTFIGRYSAEGPTIQPCLSCGLWDAGAAIVVKGKHLASWLVGQARDSSWSTEGLRTYAREIGADEEDAVKAFEEVPSMTQDEFTKIAELLYYTANQLSKEAYQNYRKSVYLKKERRIKNQLLENQAYLKTLIHTIPDLLWMKDTKGAYLSCNSRFEDFFGAEEQEIKGKTDYDFVDKELADFFRENDRKAMRKNGQNKNIEQITFANDGHTEILETIKTPIKGVNGQVIGVLGIGRDVTEIKKIEDERLNSIKLLQNLDRINTAIQKSTDLEKVLFDVLDIVLELFNCHRVYFIYPCNPNSKNWKVPIERTAPGYPGINTEKGPFPMIPGIAEAFNMMLKTRGIIKLPNKDVPPPEEALWQRFNIQSTMEMALFPKLENPGFSVCIIVPPPSNGRRVKNAFFLK